MSTVHNQTILKSNNIIVQILQIKFMVSIWMFQIIFCTDVHINILILIRELWKLETCLSILEIFFTWQNKYYNFIIKYTIMMYKHLLSLINTYVIKCKYRYRSRSLEYRYSYCSVVFYSVVTVSRWITDNIILSADKRNQTKSYDPSWHCPVPTWYHRTIVIPMI